MSIEAPTIEFDEIGNYRDLERVYDELIERACALLTPPHWLGAADEEANENLCRSDGTRFITEHPKNGEDAIMLITSRNDEGQFFVVHNERGKPGGAGGYYSAEQVLKSAVGSAVRRCAFNFALNELKPSADSWGFDEEPDDGPNPNADVDTDELRFLARGERMRLLDALHPGWGDAA